MFSARMRGISQTRPATSRLATGCFGLLATGRHHVGKRVLDVGAGPGYAAIDLAEIVGPTGEVVALERSQNFHSRAGNNVPRARSRT
jgi:tRNA(1-methyladenosine) methyltransferase and related methyltransferases